MITRVLANGSAAMIRRLLAMQKKKDVTPAESVDSKAMPYVVFQTHIIDLGQVASGRQMPTAKALQKMLERPDFFTHQGSHHELKFMWPYKEGEREVTLVASPQALTFYYQKQALLSLKLNDDLSVTKERCMAEQDQWSDKDIEELISNFNEALQIEKKCDPSAIQGKLYHYDKAGFKEMMKQCDEYNFTYRIQKTFIEGGRQRLNDFTLRLDWPFQGETHKLKLVFSRAQRFSKDFNGGELYSWLMTEESVNKLYGVKSHQFYYCLRAYEITEKETGKEEHQVLAMWMGLDDLLAELRTVHSTETFPGNAVLDLYSALDKHVFRIKNTIICDASNLFNKDKSVKIPLRLLSPLATPDNNTWYQRKLPGLSLFECDHFTTSADRVITQHSFIREKALAELQQLSLDTWSDMLDEERQHELKQLRDNFFSSTSDAPTLRELAIAVFGHAREQKVITPELALFVKLLCENTRVFKETKPFAEGDADFWVKSRVEELLGKSRFWLRERKDEDFISENVDRIRMVAF